MLGVILGVRLIDVEIIMIVTRTVSGKQVFKEA